MTVSGDEDPDQSLERLILGFQYGHVLRAFVSLGVVDLLDESPHDLGDLAARTRTDAQSLGRLLLAARALGLVDVPSEGGRYVLGPLGERLTNRPDHVYRRLADLYAPWLSTPWNHLEDAVRTGEAVFASVHGTDYWSYVADNPTAAASFNELMASGTAARAAAVADVLDLPSGTVVVDVGGGTGGLLAAVLQREPGWRGILADTEEVVAGAAEVLEAVGVRDRVEVVVTDFFQDVPSGGDVYILSRILHDWADEPAEAILRSTRAAMAVGARLVIIEGVMPEPGTTDPAHLLDLAREDLEMLVLVGGRERTLEEYRDALSRTGFDLVDVHPSPGRDVIVAMAR